MHNYKVIFGVLVGLAWAYSGWGQETVRLAGAETAYITEEQVAEPASTWENTTFRPVWTRAFFTIPWQSQNKRTLLIVRPEWQRLQFEINDIPTGQFLPATLNSFAIQLAWAQRIKENKRIALTFRPTYASEPSLPSELRGEAWIWQASFLFEKQVKPDSTFSWGVGAAYTATLARAIPVPLFKLYYQRRSMRLSVLLPGRIRHYWKVGQRVELGWFARVIGSEFQLNTAWPNPPSTPDRIQFSNVFFGPEVHWRCWKGLHVHASLGAVTRRRYTAVTSAELVDHHLNNGRFLGVGLYYGLP